MPQYGNYDAYYNDSYGGGGGSTAASARPSKRSTTRVIDVSSDQIDQIRQAQLAAFYGEPEKSLVLRKSDSDNNDSDSRSARQGAKQRGADEAYAVPKGGRSRGDDERGGQGQRRRGSSPPPSGSYASRDARGSSSRRSRRAQSEQSRSQQSQSRGQQQSQSRGQQSQSRDQQSQRGGGGGGQQNNKDNENNSQDPKGLYATGAPRQSHISPNKDLLDGQTGGRLWYSMKTRKDGTFFERNFDTSWDGLIAASAGAALGVVTVKRWHDYEVMDKDIPTEEEEKQRKNVRRLKMLGGAVVGAAAVNSAENWFRVWTEEKAERREGMMECIEMCSKGVGEFGGG